MFLLFSFLFLQLSEAWTAFFSEFPGLWDVFVHPVSLIVIGMYVVLMVWETLFPAKKLPFQPLWILRGVFMLALFFVLATYLPLFWDRYLLPYQLVDLTALPVWLATFTGILAYELLLYGWHKAMHSSNTLWRVFHQMHHSSERLDVPSAFYFSPMDMIGFTMLGSLCFSLGLGLPAEAVTNILIITNFFSIFQHANIRTPQWLGYVVQRPESHSMHHAKGVHAYNYSDLPLFDILFGTFRNPKEFVEEVGFYPGASNRVLAMMQFKDINKELSNIQTPQETVIK